jgi:carboxylesterase
VLALLSASLWLEVIIAILILLIVIFIILSIRPFKLKLMISSHPAGTFEEAVGRVKEIQKAEEKMTGLHPSCGTKLLMHGAKVDRAIVFLHGFTSCPAQFAQLGQEYFEKGYNVYLPRTPRHGLKDRLGNPLQGLTAEELAEFASQSVDIAQGLGERVIVVGLSGGGSMATWLSQQRKDINLAVPISPFLGVGFIPRKLNRSLTNLILLLPDFFMWWDPINKEKNPNSAPYSYTRYPLHALFENLRLGYVAEAEARRVKPAAGSILTITNANDESINNGVVAEFEEIWRDYGEGFLQTFQFSKDLQLPHDLITVGRPNAKVELVYPRLHELIN